MRCLATRERTKEIVTEWLLTARGQTAMVLTMNTDEQSSYPVSITTDILYQTLEDQRQAALLAMLAKEAIA